MGAAEQQRVDPRDLDRRQQTLGQHLHLLSRGLPTLDELDEAGAGGVGERDLGPCRGDGPLVRAGADRADGRDHAHPAVPRGLEERAHTGIEHSDHGHVVVEPQEVEGGRGGVVARDDDHLDVVGVDQQVGDLACELTDLVERPGPVGIAAAVAEVDDVLVGKQVDHGASHGEPSEAAVEHADGPVVHELARP